jgi:hypothetical protein
MAFVSFVGLAAGCVDPAPMLVVTARPIDKNASTLEAHVVDLANQTDVVPMLALKAGSSGFGELTQFVFILPDSASGQLLIDVLVRDASNCVLARGSAIHSISAHERVDLSVLLISADPACPPSQPGDGGT